MKKKALAIFMATTLVLSGCSSNTTENVSTDKTVTSEEVSLETYSDDYVSFEYNPDLFVVEPNEDDDTILAINCPSIPEEPSGAHNTIMGIITQSQDENVAEDEVPEFMKQLAKTTCQGLFTLNDGESITNERSKASDSSAEYYMELSDGSKCYTKVLNFNSEITLVVLRLCEYSADYNEAYMDIYNSAKSNIGNYDFGESTTPEEPAKADEPAALDESSETTEAEDEPESPVETPIKEEITLGKRNALSKAKDYLSLTAFSYTGLIDQLKYEGFTEEEATYGADNCGADWNEQAAKKAQQYLELTSFSRSGLIDQLKYEGFTSDQAAYGVTAVGY